MEIVSAQQMRRIDRYAIDQCGRTGSELMENAGIAVATAWLRDEPLLASTEVGGITPWILCGKGNNGGDGLVVARLLQESGWSPRVLLFADPATLPADSAANLQAACAAGVQVQIVREGSQWEALSDELGPTTPLLDALLGTGLRDAVRGLAATVIADINRLGPAVSSVDLPSGLDADCGAVPGVAMRAVRSYQLCRPKRCRYLRPAMEYGGDWSVLPIGMPAEAIASENCQLFINDAAAVAPFLPLRAADSHKGDHGHLLLIAGSVGKAGAAVLAGRAALRTGVGLVTVATPAKVRSEVACQQAELMTVDLDDRPAVTKLALEQCNAVALGPGLGDEAETADWVRGLTPRLPGPNVIDADGLNALARSDQPVGDGTVLTPHPGEAARLLDRSVAEIESDRLAALSRLVEKWKAVVVLKGEHTLIGAVEGAVAINTSGNAGLAAAGSGDVLTGLLGALLARGVQPFAAARLAVFLHGDAGDRAAAIKGQDGMIATDVIDALPAAWQDLQRLSLDIRSRV